MLYFRFVDSFPKSAHIGTNYTKITDSGQALFLGYFHNRLLDNEIVAVGSYGQATAKTAKSKWNRGEWRDRAE